MKRCSRQPRRGKRARPVSEQRDGAGGHGEGGRRGAVSRPQGLGTPDAPQPPPSEGERPVPLGSRGPGSALVAGSRWRPQADTRSLGGRSGRGRRAGGTRGFCSGAWVRAPRGRDDLREGRRGNLRPGCQNLRLVCGSARVWTLQRETSRGPARVGGEPTPGRHGASGLE